MDSYQFDRSFFLIGFSFCLSLLILWIFIYLRRGTNNNNPNNSTQSSLSRLKFRILCLATMGCVLMMIACLDPQAAGRFHPRLLWSALVNCGLQTLAIAFCFVLYTHFQNYYMLIHHAVPSLYTQILMMNHATFCLLMIIGSIVTDISLEARWIAFSNAAAIFWALILVLLNAYAHSDVAQMLRKDTMQPDVQIKLSSLVLIHYLITAFLGVMMIVLTLGVMNAWHDGSIHEQMASFTLENYNRDFKLYFFLLAECFFVWYSYMPIQTEKQHRAPDVECRQTHTSYSSSASSHSSQSFLSDLAQPSPSPSPLEEETHQSSGTTFFRSGINNSSSAGGSVSSSNGQSQTSFGFFNSSASPRKTFRSEDFTST